MHERVTIVGSGLAEPEAAWQLDRRGVDVDLFEMRLVAADERRSCSEPLRRGRS